MIVGVPCKSDLESHIISNSEVGSARPILPVSA